MISQLSVLSLLYYLTPIQAQLGDIIPYKYARFSECTSFIETCAPTRAYCASVACQQCTDLGETAFNNCCAQPTPEVCFASLAGGGAAPSLITSPPTTATAITDANFVACETALAIISACESLTSDFDSLLASDQASCLCYSSTYWVPQSFDDPFNSCVAFASTADVSDYPGLKSDASLCKQVGNILSAPATSVAASTTVAQTGPTKVGTTSSPTTTAIKVTGVAGGSSATAAATSKGGAVGAVREPAFGILLGLIVRLFMF